MADLNKVILIGRLTTEPEIRDFQDGGKMACFRFAVNNRRKNNKTGKWDKVPCFLDVKVNNKEVRKLADTVEEYLHKGDCVCIDGHLVLDEWINKESGKKHQKIRVMADDIRFIHLRKSERRSYHGDDIENERDSYYENKDQGFEGLDKMPF